MHAIHIYRAPHWEGAGYDYGRKRHVLDEIFGPALMLEACFDINHSPYCEAAFFQVH
jgi:hypothetical protein